VEVKRRKTCPDKGISIAKDRRETPATSERQASKIHVKWSVHLLVHL
jgi:hypothetical protein